MFFYKNLRQVQTFALWQTLRPMGCLGRQVVGSSDLIATAWNGSPSETTFIFP